MGMYKKGDHVKIEVTHEQTAESEWMWLLVDHGDDEQRLIFGALDSEPVVAKDMRRGQELAVSCDLVPEHRKFDGILNMLRNCCPRLRQSTMAPPGHFPAWPFLKSLSALLSL